MHEFPLPTAGPRAAMRYLDLPGDDLPILFVHGLGCSGSADYPEIATNPALRGHRALIIDRPGFGYSDCPDDYDCSVRGQAQTLADFIAALGLERVAVYGHSAGGAVAIELGRMLPPGVLAALIICEPNLDAGGGATSRALMAVAQDLGPTLPPATLQAVAEDAPGWAATTRIADTGVLFQEASELVAGTYPSWREQLYALAARVPTTCLFGGLSPADPDIAHLPRQRIRVDIVPGVGHFMAWQDPDAVAEAIARALRAALPSF
ncbi:MAG: alpha/beta hydrolase [Propionibacteriaceae bacterium]|nr:alpha/beta hydrolase [Propionibacteriaceae bacterium]